MVNGHPQKVSVKRKDKLRSYKNNLKYLFLQGENTSGER